MVLPLAVLMTALHGFGAVVLALLLWGSPLGSRLGPRRCARLQSPLTLPLCPPPDNHLDPAPACPPVSIHSYCECFASGRYCDGCNCSNCYNNRDHEATRQVGTVGRTTVRIAQLGHQLGTSLAGSGSLAFVVARRAGWAVGWVAAVAAVQGLGCRQSRQQDVVMLSPGSAGSSRGDSGAQPKCFSAQDRWRGE